MAWSKPPNVNDLIYPSDIGSGQRWLLMKSGSSPTSKQGTILELMDIFLHQQESTIKHIREDIQKIQRSRAKNKKNEASYKIGVYKDDVLHPNSLTWFDKEVLTYFNSIEGYSAEIDLDGPMSAGVTHPVWIKISRPA